MNREHFLTELKIHLKALSKNQLAYIIQLYNEKFDKRLAEGLTEALISQELGNPRELAQEILDELGIQPTDTTQPHDEWQEFTEEPPTHNQYGYYQNYDKNYQRPAQKSSFFIRFCQVTGVLFFNLVFMVWMIFAGLAILFSFWLVTIILVAAPLFGAIAFFSTIGAVAIFQLCFSLFLSGIGFIGLAIMIPLTKYTFRFLKYYFRWTFSTLRGNH